MKNEPIVTPIKMYGIKQSISGYRIGSRSNTSINIQIASYRGDKIAQIVVGRAVTLVIILEISTITIHITAVIRIGKKIILLESPSSQTQSTELEQNVIGHSFTHVYSYLKQNTAHLVQLSIASEHFSQGCKQAWQLLDAVTAINPSLHLSIHLSTRSLSPKINFSFSVVYRNGIFSQKGISENSI